MSLRTAKLKSSSLVLEKSIEAACRRIVTARGGRLLKLQHLRGWPDRLLLFNGDIAFVEFKRSKFSRLSLLQIDTLEWLAEHGYNAIAIKSKEKFVELLDEMGT